MKRGARKGDNEDSEDIEIGKWRANDKDVLGIAVILVLILGIGFAYYYFQFYSVEKVLMAPANESNIVYQCGTIDSAGVYVLNQSISTTGTCLTINADNVTLDGNGSAIDGDDSGSDYGVYANGRSNITMMNFANIADFYYGVYFKNTNNSAIQNSTIKSCSEGIYSEFSNFNYFSDIESGNNSVNGLTFKSSFGNNLARINSYDNDVYGVILLESSRNNFLLNITSSLNTYYGIYLSSSSNNVLAEINASNNVQAGIWLESSANNSITHVDANLNSQDGLVFVSSANNSVSRAIANFNRFAVFMTSGSDGNLISNLEAGFNTQAVKIDNSLNNQIVNAQINSSNYGIYLSNSNNTLLREIVINNSNNYHIYLTSNSGNNSLVNASYFPDEIYFVESGSSLYKKWYLDVSSNVDSAVSWQDSSGNSGSGNSPVRFELTEYYFNGTGRVYYSPYTITASKSGYTSASENVNMSENNAILFTLSASGGGDGGGGGGGGGSAGGSGTSEYWQRTIPVTGNLESGYSGNLMARERFSFVFNGGTHYIGVVEVNNNLKYAKINVSSIMQQAILEINESKDIDLDADLKNDIYIKLENIINNQANLKFGLVKGNVTEGGNGNQEPENETIEKGSNLWVLWLVIGIVIAVIIAGIVAIYLKKRNSGIERIKAGI